MDQYKKNIKVRVTGPVWGVTGDFPAQRATNAKKNFYLMTSSWFTDLKLSLLILINGFSMWQIGIMIRSFHTRNQYREGGMWSIGVTIPYFPIILKTVCSNDSWSQRWRESLSYPQITPSHASTISQKVNVSQQHSFLLWIMKNDIFWYTLSQE